MLSVKFFTMSQFHNKNPVSGSTHIRVNQLINYWPQASLYQYGDNPDVLIFQKVYCHSDYKFPAHFPGKKILDICDPDWMGMGVPVKETIDAMDAVVCPTKAMQKFLQQMTDKPVELIKDRFDIEKVPAPKSHSGDAKTVVWFGYSHNAELLKPAIPLIEQHNLKLIVISDDDPIMYRWGHNDMKKYYEFIKYDEDTIYQDLQKADFCMLPKGNRPEDKFKSENKTIKANLAGLPVVYDLDTFERFMDGVERQRLVSENWERTKADYDVKRSVEEYKELIGRL